MNLTSDHKYKNSYLIVHAMVVTVMRSVEITYRIDYSTYGRELSEEVKKNP